MIILGLTGSIGMGKSTAAAMLRRLGVPVHDSDAAVHRLIGPGGRAVAAVGAAFPGVVVDGAVDRPALGAKVFGDPVALKKLESILHPMVGEEKGCFLRREASRRTKVVALDVPLLFETGGDRGCDATILITAPPFIQAARVLRRPGMTKERLEEIMVLHEANGCPIFNPHRYTLEEFGLSEDWIQTECREVLDGYGLQND